MHVTDTFAATAAVTIPVLMLAGTVELRNLSDSVVNEIIKWPAHFFLSIAKLVKTIQGLSQKNRWAKVALALKLVLKGPVLVPFPGGVAYFLALTWLAAVVLSAVSESFCFLYLGEVHVPPSGTAWTSVIAILTLTILLIAVPATRTLISSVDVASSKFGTDAELLSISSKVVKQLVALDVMDVKTAEKLTQDSLDVLRKAKFKKARNVDSGWPAYRRRIRPKSPPTPRWVTRERSTRTSRINNRVRTHFTEYGQWPD